MVAAQRASALAGNTTREVELDDEWLATHAEEEEDFTASGDAAGQGQGQGKGKEDGSGGGEEDEDGAVDISSLSIGDGEPGAGKGGKGGEEEEEDSDDDVPDMDEYEEENLIVEDGGNLTGTSGFISRSEPEGENDNIQKTRSYDVSITYDNYYKTPRVWLFGYDEDRKPLTPEQILEDVYADHANKTVTIEAHPHLGMANASIHPCKHGHVMKKFIDQQPDVRVDQYLFLFLKFISCVVPYIQYDNTAAM